MIKNNKKPKKYFYINFDESVIEIIEKEKNRLMKTLKLKELS
jgi:hypothetical protein